MPMHELSSRPAPLTLRIASLTGEQHDWLSRIGCICLPIPHIPLGHPYHVTFPPGTRREALPRPLDRRRVNRDFLITLPGGQTLSEICMPGNERILFLTPATGRASTTRPAHASERRTP